jgi:hypothetical protein
MDRQPDPTNTDQSFPSSCLALSRLSRPSVANKEPPLWGAEVPCPISWLKIGSHEVPQGTEAIDYRHSKAGYQHQRKLPVLKATLGDSRRTDLNSVHPTITTWTHT